MGEEAGVAKDLELLADFVFDVAVVGMKFFQFAGEGVGVGGGEFLFVEAADGVEDVQCPAALLRFDFRQWFDLAELCPDIFCGGSHIVSDDGNSCVGGNAVERDVATNPTGAASGDC